MRFPVVATGLLLGFLARAATSGGAGSANRAVRVTSPAEGLKAIRSKLFTDNHKKSLKVKRKHKVAVLVPCAQTKPFPDAPSHAHGYLPALKGLSVDTYVVSEPLGVVPYSWSRTYPNFAYDFPPKHLTGAAREALVERIREWLTKVGAKYTRLVAALPAHHAALLRDAAKGLDLDIVDASITRCRAAKCSKTDFRATSNAYKAWLRSLVKRTVAKT